MVGQELSGEKVRLRPLCRADLADRVEWLADEETVRLFTGAPPIRVYAFSDVERWKSSLESDNSSVVWGIETLTGRHIGDIDLHSIDRSTQIAKLTVLIGDMAFRDQGYGTDTIMTLLHHAFSSMGLSTIFLRVYDFNQRAIRCYERCGFTRIEMINSERSEPREICMAANKQSFMAEGPNAFSF